MQELCKALEKVGMLEHVTNQEVHLLHDGNAKWRAAAVVFTNEEHRKEATRLIKQEHAQMVLGGSFTRGLFP